MSNGAEGLIQIAISGFFGALASVGQLLSSAKILTTRRIFASLVAGITGGIVAGGLFGFSFPDYSQNHLLVACVGSAGGALGVHTIILYFMLKHAPEILKNDSHPDSTTVKKLIESGEFTQEEIESLIAQARAKREKIKTIV